MSDSVKSRRTNVYRKKRNGKLLIPILVLILLGLLAGIGWMWYDTNVDRSGWVRKNGLQYYHDFHGRKVTGWLELDGKTYYLNEDGAIVTGWQQVDGLRRYFRDDGTTGAGWLTDQGNRYYLLRDGIPATGWQMLEGRRFYFNADGTTCEGWQDIDGSRYYFDSAGAMCTGWIEDQEDRYYLTEDGTPLSGPLVLEDRSYYFEDNGRLFHGWIDLEDGRHYYGEDGMATGWQEIDGKQYCFGENGVVYTGWLDQGEYRYYFTEDGSAATGPMEIDGQAHYFTPKGIDVLLVNYCNPVPENYHVDLVRSGPWGTIARSTESALNKMLNDCKAQTGLKVYLNCGYRSYDQQVEIMDNRTEEYVLKGMTQEAAYAKALETVAVPGYSEHQLGLAMDIVCSEETSWLIDHCWEYGFILRYPPDKSEITHIVYEHWHFRYVGTEVSMDMKDTGLCLEEYLGAA